MNDNHSECDNMSYRNTWIHNLLLKSHLSLLDQSRKQIRLNVTQETLHEQHNSLRSKLLLAIHNPIISALSSESRFMLRAQAISTSLACRESLQQKIQDQEESLLLTQFRRVTSNPALPVAAQSLHTLPKEIQIHHDVSLGKVDADTEFRSTQVINTNTRYERDPTYSFPCRLHEILSNPEYSECITWLPHGRAWKILRLTQFECLVIPRHFRHRRYSSFMRQVRHKFGDSNFLYHHYFDPKIIAALSANNSLLSFYKVNGWGFQRITEGPDHNAYFHPVSCFKLSMY
jgi:HSF-type DNA-binding